MKSAQLVLIAAVALCVAGFGCGRPNSRVIKAPDGTEITGEIPKHQNDAKFYFLNNPDFGKAAGKWVLRVNGVEMELASVSPEVLRNAGAEVSVPDYVESKDEVHGFIGWGVQNRDGGIELKFKSGRLKELQMHWHLPTASPFEFSVGNSGFLSMPLSELQIRSAFGNTVEIKDVYLQ